MKARCGFCNKTTLNPLFPVTDCATGSKFILYRCPKCLTASPLPRPGKNLLSKRFYKNYRKGDATKFYPIIERFLRLFYSSRIKLILGLRKKGSLLDIGCGRGTELKMLKKLGWNVLGTEISKDALVKLQTSGVSVTSDDIWKISERTFDVIMFWHSIEHLYQPKKALTSAARLLKPGGFLILATPDFESPEANLFKQNWFDLDPPRHLFLFSKKSLTHVTENLGFLLKKTSVAFEQDVYCILQSSLNFLFPGDNNLLYELLRGKQLPNRQKLLFFFQVPFIPFLFLISLLVALILEIFGKSGTMVLIFQKR